jgi:hypothetical protein
MADDNKVGPNVDIEQVSHRRKARSRTWLLQWKIKNLTRAPLTISTVRLPHSQFRSSEQQISPAIKAAPRDTISLETDVACDEASGTVIENAFLILLAIWRQRRWRILARFRVTIDADGVPRSVTESITTQRVGFSARGL